MASESGGRTPAEMVDCGTTNTAQIASCWPGIGPESMPAAEINSCEPTWGLLILTATHPATVLGGPWIELGTEREGLLQVLDENPNFGGQPAAGRPYGKDWCCSLKGSQKTDDGTFSEFRREQPRRRLRNPKMFQNTHSHLFNIAGTEDACGDNTLRVLSGTKAPRLDGAPLDKNDGSKAVETVRRCRCTMASEVLRGGDENGRRLRESSRDQSGVWQLT